MLAADTFERNCPTRTILDQVTNRWGTLIIVALIGGPHRFSALNAKVGGISQKMLAQNLRALVRAGLIERSVVPTVPPQVTYALTELGADLATPLCALIQWIGAHAAQLLEAQSRYDTEAATSRPDSG